MDDPIIQAAIIGGISAITGAIVGIASGIFGSALGFLGATFSSSLQAKVQRDVAESESRDRFSLVANEKRLEVAQEAFNWWLQVVRNFYDQEALPNIVSDALRWWDDNCLYLDEKVRDDFRMTVINAMNYRTIARQNPPGNYLATYMDGIIETGSKIQKSVGLPPLSGEVKSEIRDDLDND